MADNTYRPIIERLRYGDMEAVKLPQVLCFAIKAALSFGRKLSWKVQENSSGMLIQLVWKSSKTNMVGSVWNNPRPKSPSRLRRDALRSQKFNAAKSSLDEATEKLSTSDHPKLISFHSDCGN